MKFIYACDIHGDESKYEKLFEQAKKQNIKYLVLGGDLLPKMFNDRKLQQTQFIQNYLNEYFTKLKENDIECICILGNDDLEILDNEFDKMCKAHTNVFNIDNKRVDIEDISFIGLSKVLDHPFGCKDRVVIEAGLKMPMQLSYKIFINKCQDKITIDEWEKYREIKIEKMEDILKSLPKIDDNKKTIYVFHNPPYGIDLDVCADGRQVGSKAMTEFLENSNAYMSLHGHIHESPRMSGLWYNVLGKTICIQPGQTELRNKEMFYIIVDTENNSYEIFKK